VIGGEANSVGSTVGQYGVTRFPTTLVINREGILAGELHARDAAEVSGIPMVLPSIHMSGAQVPNSSHEKGA
jgi:hypothetical protein